MEFVAFPIFIVVIIVIIAMIVSLLTRPTNQSVTPPKIEKTPSQKQARLRKRDGSFYPIGHSGTPQPGESWVNYPLWVEMGSNGALSGYDSHKTKAPIENYDSGYRIDSDIRIDTPYNSNSSTYSSDTGSSGGDGGGGGGTD